MDGYVEKLGDIGKNDLERKDLKDTVLKELGVHTENISQLTEQRKVRLSLGTLHAPKKKSLRLREHASCL